jgi:SAM-dependent methyltransferase
VSTASVAAPRGRYHGMLQILQYNLPMYAVAAGACLAGTAAVALLPLSPAPSLLIVTGLLLAGFWSVSSLLVSHWIYDLSPLSRWGWPGRCLPAPPRRWASLHAGLDETHGALAELFPEGGRALDLYDPAEMTEPSIARARRLSLDPAAEPADFRALPFPSGSLDAVFVVFAAHELRRPESRLRLFGEIARSLAPGGRAVVVEHLRDLRNFLAFGPGFLHFLPRREWLRLARESGLAAREERRITPFVAVFILEKTP